jgi:hypothetical protein
MRHRIGWLLWMEDVAPIREKDCWSQRIRKDLRQMRTDSRKAWLAIFENSTTGQNVKPPAGWNKKAKAALAVLPKEEFVRRVSAWLEPLRAEEPLRLTVCGRDVLRTFMWYAMLVQDPALDEAISGFASANWRTKRDQSCSEAILPTFFHVMRERSEQLAFTAFETLHGRNVEFHGKLLLLYQELAGRLGRTPWIAPAKPVAAIAAADPGTRIVAMLRRSDPQAKVAVENERLIVTGARDIYEMGIYDASIVRRSDGRTIRLELDFSQPGLAMLRSMLDYQDLHDPFKPNYMRLAICARILLNDDINAKSIVAE